jgi:hypothetical protein
MKDRLSNVLILNSIFQTDQTLISIPKDHLPIHPSTSNRKGRGTRRPTSVHFEAEAELQSILLKSNLEK